MKNLLPALILENYKNNKFDGELVAFTMFADISGFTSLTEELMKNESEGAEVLSEIIKNIFNSTVGRVYKSGGFITTFARDAFTVLFPIANETSQCKQFFNIMKCAEEILLKFQKNSLQRTKYGNFKFKVKIGFKKIIFNYMNLSYPNL